MPTVSNFIGVGGTLQTFVCKIGAASGGYQGTIRTLFDKRFTTLSNDTAASAWNAAKIVADPDGLNLVYVAVTVIGSSSGFYVGKAAKDLKTRYSDAKPTKGGKPGGLQKVFDDYDANGKNSPSLDITIYGTSHPCFIEGWCFQAGSDKSYGSYNILDPN